MAQDTPSNMLYAQAADAIRKLLVSYSTNKDRSPQQLATSITTTLSQFSERAGKAVTLFEEVKRSEPPQSAKMNRFWNSYQTDVNLLQDQVDLLNASTVFFHNYNRTEILKAKKENLRIQNKIKTLELYSSASDNSLLYFGDTFITEDFIDWTMVAISERATLLGSGYVSLHLQQQQSAFDKDSKINVLDKSNGFFGNNQELKDVTQAQSDPISGQKVYEFKSETYKASSPKYLFDDRPNTWFEFEKYLVPIEARTQAKNYNFDYTLANDNEITSHFKKLAAINEQQTSSLINWADGLTDGILKFYFEIDLGSNQAVNVVNILPYGLENNVNNPIHILKVTTSLNGTDWKPLNPENVWISNSVDKKISNINAENIRIGSATWVTDGSIIRFIRFEIEQPKPIDCDVGHIYYVNKTGPAANTPNYMVTTPVALPGSLDYDNPLAYDNNQIYGGLAEIVTPTLDGGYSSYALIDTVGPMQIQPTLQLTDAEYRRKGPVAPAENPQFYLKARNAVTNDLIQKIESIPGKRWAIGIRDISVKTNVYEDKGVIVSKKFNIPGIVDRVALEADIIIPNGYEVDTHWIKFYVSPDDGSNWFEISRIQDDFAGIPEIIAFNDPTPVDLREPGVGYYNVKGTVDSLRFKAEITRPSAFPTSTPVLKSYKLKVVKRS